MAIRRRTTPQLAPSQQKPKAQRIPAEDRRARFIDEYMLDLNGTQAAIRAGFSPNGASVTASRLLGDSRIRGEIEQRIEEREERRRAAERKILARYEISHDRIKGELARLAFSNVLDFGQVDSDGAFRFDMSATSRDEAAALSSMKVKRTRRIIGKGDGATVIEDVETQFRLSDKRAALVDLGKATGLFSDGPDISIPVTFIVERTQRGKKQGEAA